MSKRIITINRMYGSGGRAIGKALAEELGIGFYDRELIEIAAKKKNIPLGDLADVDEKRPGVWSFPVNHEIQINPEYLTIPMNDVLFELQRDIILSLSDKEDCVIVGRCANHILLDRTSVFIDEKWLDMGQYDLCIDSSRFTTEEIVKILKEAYER